MRVKLSIFQIFLCLFFFYMNGYAQISTKETKISSTKKASNLTASKGTVRGHIVGRDTKIPFSSVLVFYVK